MKTWTPAATVKQTTCLCRDTGGKGTLPAQHTTFNTLDNWAIKTPPNQKGKGPERKSYRVMARNMYTIHSVTILTVWRQDSEADICYNGMKIRFRGRHHVWRYENRFQRQTSILTVLRQDSEADIQSDGIKTRFRGRHPVWRYEDRIQRQASCLTVWRQDSEAGIMSDGMKTGFRGRHPL